MNKSPQPIVSSPLFAIAGILVAGFSLLAVGCSQKSSSQNPDKLQREVKQGELLGKIISPYTFEELERLEAPCDGWLKWVSRPYPVRPGEWALGIADADGAEWIKP